MSRTFGLAALVLGAAPAALAQETEVSARLSLAASAMDEDSVFAPAADGVLGDAAVVITRTDTLDSGLRLIWRGEARIQRDAPSRPRFAGAFGICDPADPGCPSLGGLSPVSPATGVAAGGTPHDDNIAAALEGASLSVIGPWGEGVFGLDTGVAARLDARAPQVLDSVSAFSPALDPTGLGLVRARNDVTGASAKASYMSPRLLGLRLGASYTPETHQRGVDFDPRPRGPGLAAAEFEDVWEGAVSFARRMPQSGVRVRAAVTATFAGTDSPYGGFGNYEAWGAGLEVENGAWTGGVRWLGADNAMPDGSGYQAWELGLVRQGDKWRFGLEAGWAEDDLNRTEGTTLLAGVQRRFGDNLAIGAAWTAANGEFPAFAAPGGHINVRNEGLVVELSVRN